MDSIVICNLLLSHHLPDVSQSDLASIAEYGWRPEEIAIELQMLQNSGLRGPLSAKSREAIRKFHEAHYNDRIAFGPRLSLVSGVLLVEDAIQYSVDAGPVRLTSIILTIARSAEALGFISLLLTASWLCAASLNADRSRIRLAYPTVPPVLRMASIMASRMYAAQSIAQHSTWCNTIGTDSADTQGIKSIHDVLEHDYWLSRDEIKEWKRFWDRVIS